MGIKFGEIDANQILENEFRINVLERVLTWMFQNNPSLKGPDTDSLDKIRQEVMAALQQKYPNSGLKYQSTQNVR